MCLKVIKHSICGAVARTEVLECAFLAGPFPQGQNETHHLQEFPMVLPRDEWDDRQGMCPQEGCPQNDASTAGAELTKCPGCSSFIIQGEPPADLTLNNAKFLDRSLWHEHSCPIEFCAFNLESMIRVNENLDALIEQVEQSYEEVAWTPDDDDLILEFSSLGIDVETLAQAVGKTVAQVQYRLAYLHMLREPGPIE